MKKGEKLIKKVKSFKWGDKHGVMLDMKGRVFTTGESLKGKLGLLGTLPETLIFPRQITYGLPSPVVPNQRVTEVFVGYSHSMAVTKSGEIYTWGEGAYGRLGLGFLEDSVEIPNQTFPSKVPPVFDNNSVVTAGCGKLISGVAMLTGSFYMWGKGIHERSKENDHMEFSSPKMILEQKQITHVSFGLNHVMVLDKMSALYGFGDGSKGCMGFGDCKKRYQPYLLSFFQNKRVYDVSCGDTFTVVLAEVEGDPEYEAKLTYGDDGLIVKKTELKSGLIFDMNRALVDESVLKANRTQVCGSMGVSLEVIEKVKRILENKAALNERAQSEL